MTEARETEQRAERGNRRERRARLSRIARFGGRGRKVLQTALLDVGKINLHPHSDVMRSAANFWRASGPSSTTCFACKGPTPHPPAFLFAWTGGAPKQAAVAGLCRDCWTEGDPVAIDAAATRTLRQVVSNGRFLDPREVRL